MKIKVNQIILDEFGKPIKQGDKPPVSLRDVCVQSLLGINQKDDQEKKWKKYEVFKKLREVPEDGIVELKTEEVALMKECIGFFQAPLIMGQAFDMIEQSK